MNTVSTASNTMSFKPESDEQQMAYNLLLNHITKSGDYKFEQCLNRVTCSFRIHRSKHSMKWVTEIFAIPNMYVRRRTTCDYKKSMPMYLRDEWASVAEATCVLTKANIFQICAFCTDQLCLNEDYYNCKGKIEEVSYNIHDQFICKSCFHNILTSKLNRFKFFECDICKHRKPDIHIHSFTSEPCRRHTEKICTACVNKLDKCPYCRASFHTPNINQTISDTARSLIDEIDLGNIRRNSYRPVHHSAALTAVFEAGIDVDSLRDLAYADNNNLILNQSLYEPDEESRNPENSRIVSENGSESGESHLSQVSNISYDIDYDEDSYNSDASSQVDLE